MAQAGDNHIQRWFDGLFIN